MVSLSPSLLDRYTRANGGTMDTDDTTTDDPLRGLAIGLLVSIVLWLAVAAAAWPLLRAALGGVR